MLIGEPGKVPRAIVEEKAGSHSRRGADGEKSRGGSNRKNIKSRKTRLGWKAPRKKKVKGGEYAQIAHYQGNTQRGGEDWKPGKKKRKYLQKGRETKKGLG